MLLINFLSKFLLFKAINTIDWFISKLIIIQKLLGSWWMCLSSYLHIKVFVPKIELVSFINYVPLKFTWLRWSTWFIGWSLLSLHGLLRSIWLIGWSLLILHCLQKIHLVHKLIPSKFTQPIEINLAHRLFTSKFTPPIENHLAHRLIPSKFIQPTDDPPGS